MKSSNMRSVGKAIIDAVNSGAVEAFENKQPIQFRYHKALKENDIWVDFTEDFPKWGNAVYEWRVKPEEVKENKTIITWHNPRTFNIVRYADYIGLYYKNKTPIITTIYKACLYWCDKNHNVIDEPYMIGTCINIPN